MGPGSFDDLRCNVFLRGKLDFNVERGDGGCRACRVGTRRNCTGLCSAVDFRTLARGIGFVQISSTTTGGPEGPRLEERLVLLNSNPSHGGHPIEPTDFDTVYLRSAGRSMCARRIEHLQHGVVGIVRREVAVDPLDHAQRAVAGDLRHEHRAHAGAQGVGDEAVAEQMGVHPLLDAGTIGGPRTSWRTPLGVSGS